MSLIEFILASDNIPFSFAITLVVVLGFLEGFGRILGLAMSKRLDSFVLKVDPDKLDAGDTSASVKLLEWFGFWEVSALAVLTSFLISFGLIGYIIQALIVEYLGKYPFNAWFVGPIALIVCLPLVKGFVRLLSKIIPKDDA